MEDVNELIEREDFFPLPDDIPEIVDNVLISFISVCTVSMTYFCALLHRHQPHFCQTGEMAKAEYKSSTGDCHPQAQQLQQPQLQQHEVSGKAQHHQRLFFVAFNESFI